MDGKQIVNKIKTIGILPVLSVPDPAKAVDLANALIRGGIPVMEIMLRTPDALKSIRAIAETCPEMLIAAGTVLSEEQADASIRSGASFLVSPGLDSHLVSYCLSKGYPIVPGVSTPSEVQCAVSMGLKALKFFPAGVPGGFETLKSFHGPFPDVEFVVTGGINDRNYLDYLALPHVFAVYGGFVAPSDLVAAGSFDLITERCRRAIAGIFGFEIAHVGINCENEKDSLAFAELFSRVLNVPITEYPNCHFAGTLLEINKAPGRGRNGHIGLLTRDLVRAAAYAESRGIAFDWDKALFFPGSKRVKCVYFKNDIAGFAFHLLQKE